MLCNLTTCYRIEIAWSQRLQLDYDTTAFKLCFQFQLAPLQLGRTQSMAARVQQSVTQSARIRQMCLLFGGVVRGATDHDEEVYAHGRD